MGILDKLGYHTVEEQSSKVVSCVVIYTDQDKGNKLPNSLTVGKSIDRWKACTQTHSSFVIKEWTVSYVFICIK